MNWNVQIPVYTLLKDPNLYNFTDHTIVCNCTTFKTICRLPSQNLHTNTTTTACTQNVNNLIKNTRTFCEQNNNKFAQFRSYKNCNFMVVTSFIKFCFIFFIYIIICQITLMVKHGNTIVGGGFFFTLCAELYTMQTIGFVSYICRSQSVL